MAGPPNRHVPPGLYWSAKFFAATAGLWKRLGALESAVLRDEIESDAVDRPIYVAGAARSGTTIITEMLSRHPDVTSHRYADFPNVYTPYWRNWLASRIRRAPGEPVERAHRDRLMVTSESPEAVEEVIWMQFFDHLHDPAKSQVLDASTTNPAFETFYRDHIRKLLMARDKTRYLAKGNYNVTRLGYILKLFPDARFIIPVRNPVNHVASLVKQDRLFDKAATEDPRVTRQLHRSGHFEFGPGKCCINPADKSAVERIERDWAAGRLAAGWAGYWAAVYSSLLAAAESDRSIEQAVLFIRYEDLCRSPGETIDRIVEHSGLPAGDFDNVRREYISKLAEPDYYETGFGDDELTAIRTIAGSVGRRFGYE